MTTGARFAPDPAKPGRRRYWDGWHWTARVLDADGDEGIAWTPTLLDLPHPAPAPVVTPRIVEWQVDRTLDVEPDAPTRPDIARSSVALAGPALHVPTLPAPSMPAPVTPGLELALAFGPRAAAPEPTLEAEPPPKLEWLTVDPTTASEPELPTIPEARVPGSRRRRIVMAIGAAAAALIGLAAAAGAGVFTSSAERPEIEDALAYRDAEAGFELRYPDDWRVLRRDRGSSIRFAIASPGASTNETNTVSVVVGASAAELPPLHSLAAQLTDMLRQKLPGVRLESAARTRLAEAPGFRFSFRDPDTSPATRIDQYVGRTTSGLPLTVTVTVREPRTAPSAQEMREFLASLRSGKLDARS